MYRFGGRLFSLWVYCMSVVMVWFWVSVWVLLSVMVRVVRFGFLVFFLFSVVL